MKQEMHKADSSVDQSYGIKRRNKTATKKSNQIAKKLCYCHKVF
jgi:hypothetical protein